MTGLSQSEAAAVLRGIPQNSHVQLVISRQVTEEDDVVLASENTVRLFPVISGFMQSLLTVRLVGCRHFSGGFRL
jgi:hypothetical protein